MVSMIAELLIERSRREKASTDSNSKERGKLDEVKSNDFSSSFDSSSVSRESRRSSSS